MKDILDEALSRSSEDRSQFVEVACAGDVELRTVVDSLLKEADADTCGFLESPAVLPPAVYAPEIDWTGRRLDGYEVIRRIGLGGMGQVLLARDTLHHPGRCVAIKTMRGGVISPGLRRRFMREQQFQAELHHPMIPRLIRCGEYDGQPYMVTDFVDGQPIDAFCRQRKLPLDERIRLFMKLCVAVAYVHSQDIVHCDLKPANILVTARGEPQLLDFGIAERRASPGGARSSEMLHLEGVAMFTPECAAPEQLSNEAITEATDIYGLGLLLYRLLTGKLPHHAPRDGLTLADPFAERAPAVASFLAVAEREHEEAGLPPAGRLSELLRGELDAILLRAVAQCPGERFPSALALRDALARYLHRSSPLLIPQLIPEPLELDTEALDEVFCAAAAAALRTPRALYH